MAKSSQAGVVPIAVAHGDGIGPEIMEATLHLLDAAGAKIAPTVIELGEKVFKRGIATAIAPGALEAITETGVLLKAPIATPQGGGYKSVNVTLRKSFGLFANVRPVRTFEPYVPSKYAKVDMVIVRENEEGLYAGIEYRQTRDTCHSIKFASRTGTEMIIHYAFAYARANGRKKVTCLVKDNIMKISDGLFHKVFDKIGAEIYPDIARDTMIVDIGMARVADTPEKFDVLVSENLYGDIVSDIATQVAGSVGFAGSSNIGHGCAMFEAVHGTAPDIAGKGVANPSGLINGAIIMLQHIGQADVATLMGNAWLRTIEQGSHTGDIAKDKTKALGTKAFVDAIVKNLGKKPEKLVPYAASGSGKFELPQPEKMTLSTRAKQQVGVDVFLDWRGSRDGVMALGKQIEQSLPGEVKLHMVSSRGLVFYPTAPAAAPVTDHFRCRFMAKNGVMNAATTRQVLSTLEMLGLAWITVECLYTYDGEAGYTSGAGE